MIINSMKQAAQVMWFYNRNQIQRMKIKKRQFEENRTITMFPEREIEKVVYPFLQQIYSSNISVYIARKDILDVNLKLDWKNYQLILYNMIQNSIKYNFSNGIILILLNLKRRHQMEESFSFKSNEDENFVLETEVVDTGIGITDKRQ